MVLVVWRVRARRAMWGREGRERMVDEVGGGLGWIRGWVGWKEG